MDKSILPANEKAVMMRAVIPRFERFETISLFEPMLIPIRKRSRYIDAVVIRSISFIPERLFLNKRPNRIPAASKIKTGSMKKGQIILEYI